METSRLPAGSTLGAYRIDALLGEGAFGVVYRAFGAGRAVALKVLHAVDGEGVGRFKREAELAARLTHPNVVRVLDSGTDRGAHFIVFELLEGRSLEDAIAQRGRMVPALAVDLTLQILSALEAAHAIGLVHRDIKPANVFLVERPDAGWNVKVVDFGLAKSTKPGTLAGLTQAGTTLGTPIYMSPEQVAGEPLGPPSDLFAVGLVLAEMLHGGSLFDEMPVMVLLTERLSGKRVQLPRSLDASPLRAVIERATAPLPAHRFASATAMKIALAAATNASGDAARFTHARTEAIRLVEDARPIALPAPAPPRSPTIVEVPSRRGPSRLLVAAVGALIVGGVAVALVLLLANGSFSGRDESSAKSAKRALSAPTPSAVAPAQAPDFFTDIRPLLANLERKFHGARIQSFLVNGSVGFVTIEASVDGRTELHWLDATTAKLHGESQAPRQREPFDPTLPLLQRVPELVRDARARVGDALHVESVEVICASCRNGEARVYVLFADAQKTLQREVSYDRDGRFLQ